MFFIGKIGFVYLKDTMGAGIAFESPYIAKYIAYGMG